MYQEFTTRKTSSLQTWVSVGGFKFSNPGSYTHQTWKLMTARDDWRANFITSIENFMGHYGFQGVDLDWEYPSAGDRGGSINDAANYVALVRQMRNTWNNKYGISVTLPPNLSYLRGFDPKSMEPWVDFFNYMSYDVHEISDARSIVNPHTDMIEIQNDTTALWSTHVDAKKINFGVSNFGRGYRLADPRCHTPGCNSTGPSNPASCTNSPGIMSNIEINDLIKQKALKPQLVPNTMSKQITWDDQWIGYDDDETMNQKISWAAQHCFGGIMLWSVDMNLGEGR